MENIQWEPVDITPHSVQRGKPYARVTNSSVTFNGAAAALIQDIEQYPWVLVRVGRVEGEPAMLAFQFVSEQQEGAFAVRKQSKKHKGVAVFSRELVKKYIAPGVVGLMLMQLPVEPLDNATLLVKLAAPEEAAGAELQALEGMLDEL